MATLREENGLYERRVMNAITPAVELIAMGSTIGTAFWVRVLVTDDTSITVDDVTADYDLNDLKTIVDGIANSSSDTGVVIAKDANGVVSIST